MTDLLLALTAWYACGVAGYGYWCFDGWRPERAAEWGIALAVGLLGPVVPLAGWLVRLVCGNDTPDDRGPDDRGPHDGGPPDGGPDSRGDDWRDGGRRLIPIRIDSRRRRRR